MESISKDSINLLFSIKNNKGKLITIYSIKNLGSPEVKELDVLDCLNLKSNSRTLT